MQWKGNNLKYRHGFKQHIELMFTGPLKSINEAKFSSLLIWLGQKGRDIYNTCTDISEEDRQKLQTYYDRFENQVIPKSNPVFARFKFRSRNQDTLETAIKEKKFITALRILAQGCDFKDQDEQRHKSAQVEKSISLIFCIKRGPSEKLNGLQLVCPDTASFRKNMQKTISTRLGSKSTSG